LTDRAGIIHIKTQVMNDRIKDLVIKYLKDELTSEENLELQQWIHSSEKNRIAFEEATDQEELRAALKSEFESEQRVLEKLRAAIAEEQDEEVKVGTPRVRIIRYVAAAAAIVVISVAVFFIALNKKDKEEAVVRGPEIHDVPPPSSNRATITLANGKTIFLDSAANGVLESDGNVQLVKLADGQIAYSGSSDEVVYNTVSNPRGSKVLEITLGDKTRVWLNNESSIRYPVSFVGNIRKIFLTGEAYFEVSKESRKFIVEANGTSTEVLGTHFNVNAYTDEEAVTTTLLEGSVRVQDANKQVILQPGQQSEISDNGLRVINDADVEAAVAWKNGLVIFSGADMKTVLRQIGRYYGVNFEFKGDINVPDLYSKIPRTVGLSEVLKAIEINTKLKFTIEGDRVIVEQ
jgi:transmembrane sensor